MCLYPGGDVAVPSLHMCVDICIVCRWHVEHCCSLGGCPLCVGALLVFVAWYPSSDIYTQFMCSVPY